MFLPARRCASAVYATAVCLSVYPSLRPSEVGVVSKPQDVSSWFWHRGYPRLILSFLEGNSSISRNNGTSLWIVPTSKLSRFSGFFRHGMTIGHKSVNVIPIVVVEERSKSFERQRKNVCLTFLFSERF